MTKHNHLLFFRLSLFFTLFAIVFLLFITNCKITCAAPSQTSYNEYYYNEPEDPYVIYEDGQLYSIGDDWTSFWLLDNILFNKTLYDKNNITITLNQVNFYEAHRDESIPSNVLLITYCVENNSYDPIYLYNDYLLFNDYQINDVDFFNDNNSHIVEGHSTEIFYTMITKNIIRNTGLLANIEQYILNDGNVWSQLGISLTIQYKNDLNLSSSYKDTCFTPCSLNYVFDSNAKYLPSFDYNCFASPKELFSTPSFEVYFANYVTVPHYPSANVHLLLKNKSDANIDFQAFNLCVDQVPQSSYYSISNVVLTPGCITDLYIPSDIFTFDKPLDIQFKLYTNNKAYTIRTDVYGIILNKVLTAKGVDDAYWFQ